jgi:hypothetical protein
VTDADPGRDAGAINGHASTHADIELPNGHANASSANRHASATQEHAGATPHADIAASNGYAGAPTRHTEAAAAAYGHADLPSDCGCHRNA